MHEFADKPVISRFGNRAVIKIIHDQWFIDYGNPEWKEKAREALADMKIYPESRRAQFESIIDWLDEKACARKVGLGTPLPWDPDWIIESLSDSTIYMAYEVKRIDEEKALREAKDFMEKELGLEIIINAEEDKGGKKKQAMPLKPAVFVE